MDGRKPPETIIRQAIIWNPQGRSEEVGHETQRDTENETKETGYTRREMARMATDRKHWRSLVDASSDQTGISK